MATTHLEVVNAVLRRLREDPVLNSDANEYSKLIRQFVWETMEEIQEKHDFQSQRHTVHIHTQNGTSFYAAFGLGAGIKVLEVWNGTTGCQLTYGKWHAMNRRGAENLANGPRRGQPEYVDRQGLNQDRDIIFQIQPIPDGVYDVLIHAIIKQNPYVDITADDLLLELPINPLILGTYNRAVEERGDDTSSRIEFNAQNFRDALDAAILADDTQFTDEPVWKPLPNYPNLLDIQNRMI